MPDGEALRCGAHSAGANEFHLVAPYLARSRIHLGGAYLIVVIKPTNAILPSPETGTEGACREGRDDTKGTLGSCNGRLAPTPSKVPGLGYAICWRIGSYGYG